MLEADPAVLGRLVVADAELVLDAAQDLVAAEHGAQGVGADADVVLASGLAAVHRVEGRDRTHLGLGELELLGAERDAVGAHVALLGLHEVEHREQRGARLRVARDDLAHLRAGLVGQHQPTVLSEVSFVGHALAGLTGPPRP